MLVAKVRVKAHDFKGNVGFQVRIKLVIIISVRWSGSLWAAVLNFIVQAILFGILKLKESLMNILHAIVSVGAALLPVPDQGWRSTCTGLGSSIEV